MNSFYTFFEKELIELHRSKRLYILMGIFLLFGMVSPVLARFMSEIVTMAMGPSAPVMLKEPVWTDSFSQFYSNMTQMGELSILLIFMSCVSGEKQNHTAPLVLTKNLSPAKFIVAKYIASVVVMFVIFIPALLACTGYTYYLFGYCGEWKDIAVSGIAYMGFTIVLLSTTTLASTLASSIVVSAILSLGGYVLLMLSSYLPKIGVFMPGKLLTVTAGVFSQELPNSFVWALLGSFIISVLLIYLSVQLLKRQEI